MADDMDEFAQTRGADDLFDDEIIPVPAEEQPQQLAQPVAPVTVEEPAAVTVSTPVTPATKEEQEPTTPSRTDTPRSRGGGGERRGRDRGRGRGRGGRGGSRGGAGSQNSGPKRSDGAKNKSPSVETVEAEATPTQNGEEKIIEGPAETSEPLSKDEATKDEAPRVPAVRGDRSATGGVKKPKLTEEELSRRIAAARENAAKVAAAHARAEADQASFLEREKVAEQKRREERQNRRVMDNERERNRLRKLEALNGREWDAEKQEDQFSGRGGRGQFRRGMHGGISGYTRRDFGDSQPGDEHPNNNGPHNGHRGRGRGGRGGRGRGSHRGGPRDSPSGERATDGSPTIDTKAARPAPVLDNEAEFPSLPGEKKETKAVDTSLDDLKSKSLSPVSGATWAEQVEAQKD